MADFYFKVHLISMVSIYDRINKHVNIILIVKDFLSGDNNVGLLDHNFNSKMILISLHKFIM